MADGVSAPRKKYKNRTANLFGWGTSGVGVVVALGGVGVLLVGDRRGSLVESMPCFVRKNLVKTKG